MPYITREFYNFICKSLKECLYNARNYESLDLRSMKCFIITLNAGSISILNSLLSASTVDHTKININRELNS